MKNRLQEIFNELKRSLFENPIKSQHGESSSVKGNRYEKCEHGQDTKYSRMEFPKWEDGDPTGWISRAERFFHFHRIPEKSKVEIVFIQLEGFTIQWYNLYETNHGVPLWRQFKRELLICFGLSEYKNINGQLAKIRQTSTVQEYQSSFERLSNQTRDWSEIQLVREFIEGLNPEIRCEIKARHPRTMIVAISFASVHKRKINIDTRRNRSFNRQEKLTKEDFKMVNIDNRKQEQLLTIEPTKEESKTKNVESDHEGCEKLLTIEPTKEE
ncbi:hypothetical protein BHE74_00039429 [Ensete ventricosum]|nr:hypothetical protein BHE74_00039429 [Ensete ventricosum]